MASQWRRSAASWAYARKVHGWLKSEKLKQTGHGRREQPELEEIEQVHIANVEGESCELCGGTLATSL